MRLPVSTYGLVAGLVGLFLAACSNANGPEETTVLRGTITQRWTGPADVLDLGSAADSTVTIVEIETPQFSCPRGQFWLTSDTRVDGAATLAARDAALSVGAAVTISAVHPSSALNLCPLQWRARRIIVSQ